MRGGYIFDYFQEILTAAQYAVLGMKVQIIVGKSPDYHAATQNFLDHDGISNWELKPVGIIGAYSIADLIWFVFEDAWEHVEDFISEGLTPWIAEFENQCLSIIREARSESLRIRTPEQRTARALVVYQQPKNMEQPRYFTEFRETAKIYSDFYNGVSCHRITTSRSRRERSTSGARL